ncbi:PREDICTED: electroneutral sodium bicarbonate exchanger 1-like [Rhagoletis zephyria]|uniref:electroneutral sodium bicarbonate exchanger 1-like n=1 Tax=Rhagoletis zephyria TaxID=28612 RepID=UPI00081190C2|nr:PREDICTED: electroneutral sodium bicarbonate exchanger 1-like [Rhagoletis zephyria]
MRTPIMLNGAARTQIAEVPIKRVHLFTAIQLACLIILWLIKSFPQTSILFPLMLVVMIGIRKVLDLLFTRRELEILDDIIPEISTSSIINDTNHLDAEVGYLEKLKRCCWGESSATTQQKVNKSRSEKEFVAAKSVLK